MAFKLIAVDLDGTLLRGDKTVSAYTWNILQQTRERGIKVIVSTGRGFSVGKVVSLERFDGAVLNNGARALTHNGFVYSRLIANDTAKPFLLACHERGMKISGQRDGTSYTNFNAEELWPWYKDYKQIDFDTFTGEAEKIYVPCMTPEDLTFIEKHLPEGLYVSVSRDFMAMIMHRDATKSRAVAALAAHWGIDAAEIAAFGDDLNDIDMLTYAGTGVAMGNAVESVTAAADFVCESNQDDGLAKWIEGNILK